MTKSDAATFAIAGTASVGVVDPEVTTIHGGGGDHHHRRGVAAVVEVGWARRVRVVAQHAAKGATMVATTKAVAAALVEATEGRGTA